MEVTDEAKQYWNEKRICSTILSVVLVLELLYGTPYEGADPLQNEKWGGPLKELIRVALILIALIPLLSRATDFLQEVTRVKMLVMGLVVAFVLITVFRMIVLIVYYPSVNFKLVLMFLRTVFIENFLLVMSYMYTLFENDFSLDHLR
eukprot:TRINITY_DN3470_c0_g1_i7.p1 TRINITY_DN3470_c0_g1~~TRINITY_DN3470_c0_g1_i7.p1  ORF type:complete len:148 (+),score=26.60 TRINITY_DN3470_c0_g1_i7:84-527(+)